MKLKFALDINAGLADVWAAFDNPDNMRRWQPTLKSFRHISGEPGRPGAVSELVYEENGREVVMTETVTERREPDFLAGTYDNNWASTIIVNHFSKVDGTTTTWKSWCHFSFKGFMKLMSPFLRGSIRKRTLADMRRFKSMVEADLSGNE